MMLYAIKTPSGQLQAANDNDAQALRSIKIGQVVKIDIKRVRNYRFHRKFFALLNLAFDHWEPEHMEYKGHVVAKEFERFRKDILILAGYGHPVFNIKGDCRIEAESLSFASMSQERFDQCYQSVLGVIWNKLLKGMYGSQEELEATVEKLLGFE